jgi:type 1 fimbriae regulatory protein FimB/type 1 fimbriae regulatory protein FimE
LAARSFLAPFTVCKPIRDATAILIAYRHALRSSELVALRWDDIDFQAGKLHVRRAKGGTASVHPIGGRKLHALRRLKREAPASVYVFDGIFAQGKLP